MMPRKLENARAFCRPASREKAGELQKRKKEDFADAAGVEDKKEKVDKAHEGNRTLDLFFTKEVLYH